VTGSKFPLLALALALKPSLACAAAHGTPFSAPAVAAKYGFTHPVLYETWTNGTATIDLNNTKAAGFNWYVNSYFPVQNNWWNSGFNSKSAATAGQFSASNGVMTFSPLGNSDLLSTCVWNGSTVIGTTFAGGFYLDVMASFDPILAGDTSHSWPAVWMLPVEFLNGGSGISGHVVDTSVFEAYPVAGGTLCLSKCQLLMGAHDEQAGQTSRTPQYVPDVTTTMAPAFGTFSWTSLHHYQFLWVPQAKNGDSNGILSWWIDNVPMVTITYSSTSRSNPGLNPDGGVGELSYGDSSHFCLLINTGTAQTGQPINVGAFQVWQ
jgi:hypothetical protein